MKTAQHAPSHHPRRFGLLLALASALVLLAGCGSRSREPLISPSSYTGPEIRTDTDSRQHRVMLEAPSGGWRFTVDQVKKRFGAFDVFLTARRPDPTFNYTQAIVHQYAGTGVEPSVPVTVFVRIIDFTSTGEKEPYARAAESAAKEPIAQPAQPESASDRSAPSGEHTK
jgi:hypothetical protein